MFESSSDVWGRRRLARLAGPAGAAVALGSILLATLLSPTFGWTGSALSDMGTAPATARLFNGGLVAGGLLGLPFAWLLWQDAATLLARGRALAFALAVAAMAGVGLFPAGTRWHVPAALAFFALAALTLLVDGVARIRRRTGVASLLLGAAIPLAWPAWFLFGLGPGIAVPEFVGAVCFSAWVVAVAPQRALGGRRESN